MTTGALASPGRGVRRSRWLWLLALLGPALLLGFAAELWLLPRGTADAGAAHFDNLYPNVVFGSVVPMLGALILSRRPRHPLGVLFLGCGLASALTLFVYPWARSHLSDHPLPGTLVAAWVSNWIWTLGVMPLGALGLLLFPDGRPPGRRWRPLLWTGLAMIGVNVVAHAFVPGPLENHPFYDNPLGLPLPRPLFAALGTVAFGLFVIGFFGGMTAVLVRWRRSSGDERHQLRWVALSGALLAAVGVVPSTDPVGVVLFALAIPLFPVSVAVAILRHRLYGIEMVVRRSLVFGALTTLLLLLYAVVVTAVGHVADNHATGLAALGATGLVAVAFPPLRARLQVGVDRLLYGEADDPYAVLTEVGRRLDESVEDPLGEVARSMASSLRLPYVRVEVDQPGRPPLMAVHGDPRDLDLHEVPLTFRGVPVGRLVAAPRGSQDPFRAPDLRLLEDLGRQVGVVAHAVSLAADLQRSREGLVTLREEERRRIRRDLHDGLGPSLAGLALGLDAVHRIAPADPDAAARLARELADEVQTALADVRRLVEDLRPPSLDQLGLVGAVRQHADRLTVRDPGLDVAVAAGVVDGLPAAVEVAAYRIATEALTNVARHANARHAQVEIGWDAVGCLVVEVSDDGRGLPARRRQGIGLAAMRERAAELGGTCEAAPGPHGGTRVRALLPVGVGA